MDVDTLWLSVLNCYVILNKSLLKQLFVCGLSRNPFRPDTYFEDIQSSR